MSVLDRGIDEPSCGWLIFIIGINKKYTIIVWVRCCRFRTRSIIVRLICRVRAVPQYSVPSFRRTICQTDVRKKNQTRKNEQTRNPKDSKFDNDGIALDGQPCKHLPTTDIDIYIKPTRRNIAFNRCNSNRRR